MKRRHYKKLASAMAVALPGLAYSAAPVPQLGYYNEGNPASRPFTLAVRAGDYIHLSGQMGTDANGLVPGGFEAQARKTMDNIQDILKGMNLSMDHIVKCTVMIADMGKWGDFNKIYVDYFTPGRLPARSAFGVNALALGGQIEVECLAYAPPAPAHKRGAR
ncbi:RidA family protein [Massilia sp. Root351]|jgi:reactive intermediate/imine deaminase|uniref:RidA family protein n=1 Tax=Massilia sp. Root351 TaxID=1736522 RepID=UPI0009E7E16E|nr:RidA family protein [Massilia sp. Root351]